ncbi:hypothetical protein BLNAU_12473 [Blattamonas nauphoetae]|uniref:Uncharacterized protein n=1 Tax=Blattamonas nauphoetae TaxID=2049346 RepID=A0ABQ9XR35_9EUKA|nr:hypothetical protein BLNAU_12473 [Blattamonas nauphoetae]
MTSISFNSLSSGRNKDTPLTITATEKYPLKRFNELLALYSNPRFLNHVTKDQRNDLLHRFGTAMSQRDSQDIDVDSLKKIGLSHSILKQIQPNRTNNLQLVQLAQLSEICPLISVEALSEDLSSIFRNFLCNPLPYLDNDHPNRRSAFSTLMGILCNELMACSILGIGDEVYETVITNFTAFSEAILREQAERPWIGSDLSLFQKIIESSQTYTACLFLYFIHQFLQDPLEKIAAILNHLLNSTVSSIRYGGNNGINLLSQCLRHTATFLDGVPFFGGWLVANSIKWNNLQGMNLPLQS